jgi:transcriptional regulator with XRE-family HTH domain
LCKLYDMRSKRPITDPLLQAIAKCGLSFKALEKETGVKRQSLMKFARDEQTLRGDMLERLAVYFGLELRTKRKGR